MDLVRITKIADDLGISKEYALRLAKRYRLGLHYGSRRVASLSRSDADKLKQQWTPRSSRSSLSSVNDTGLGHYYLIQLTPESDKHCLKLGYTDSIPQRLADHRTTCPTLILIKEWPCHRTWEAAATASITRTDAELLGGEVYQGDALVFEQRGDKFFALLPDTA